MTVYSGVLTPLTRVKEIVVAGTQVIYIPAHIQSKYEMKGGISRAVLRLINNERLWTPSGPQLGFVTSIAKDGCFCRYFNHRYLDDPMKLRTKNNSELTPWDLLFLELHKPAEYIDRLILELNS